MAERIGTYQEFWPYYLAEHSKPLTRWLHLAGILLGAATFTVGCFIPSWILMVASLPVGYTLAWGSHWLVERNRPATFKYPVWSFVSDFRMAWLLICGSLK